MEFDWVVNCELGWFVGPKFLLCDGLGWVELKKLVPRTTLRGISPVRKDKVYGGKVRSNGATTS